MQVRLGLTQMRPDAAPPCPCGGLPLQGNPADIDQATRVALVGWRELCPSGRLRRAAGFPIQRATRAASKVIVNKTPFVYVEGKWGDHLELECLAQMHDLHITVVEEPGQTTAVNPTGSRMSN